MSAAPRSRTEMMMFPPRQWLGWLVGLVGLSWRWFLKRFMHVVTRQSEIERILNRPRVSAAMADALFECIRRSNVLRRCGVQGMVLGDDVFDVEDVVVRLVDAKRIGTTAPHFARLILPNLRTALGMLNRCNGVRVQLAALRGEPFEVRRRPGAQGGGQGGGPPGRAWEEVCG